MRLKMLSLITLGYFFIKGKGNNQKCCILLLISAVRIVTHLEYKPSLTRCKSFQVVVGCSRSLLACYRSFQVFVGRFRFFLACCRSFQVVSGRSAF